MDEKTYQRGLVRRIRDRWPDCFVMKPDAQTDQGVPDLLILFNNTWAMLEVKLEEKSIRQPNQVYHVERFDNMSFASFIYPENEEAVLDALQSALRLPREARVS